MVNVKVNCSDDFQVNVPTMSTVLMLLQWLDCLHEAKHIYPRSFLVISIGLELTPKVTLVLLP